MKTVLSLLAWSVVACVIMHLAVNPASGVIFQSPLGAIGVGLIGLGACVEARKKMSNV